MQRIMLKSKIHRARVTGANIDYEGSLTLDEELMEAASLKPYEKIEIYNITNGNRFETYVIKGAPGSGTVCVNGAAAWLAKDGDVVIIASYAILESEEETLEPRLIYVDESNSIVSVNNRCNV